MNAHTANLDPGHFIVEIIAIIDTALDVEADVSMFRGVKRAARKCLWGTFVDARLAFTTLIFNGTARHKKSVS